MIWNKNSGKKLNIIFAVISIVLVLVLGTIIIADHRSTGKETERLTELADKEKKGIEDYENVKKRAAELAEQSSESEEDSSKEKNTESDTSNTDTNQEDSDKTENAEEKQTQVRQTDSLKKNEP